MNVQNNNNKKITNLVCKTVVLVNSDPTGVLFI